MSALARTAQIFSMIVAVLFCHGALTDERPIAFTTAANAYEGEPASVRIKRGSSSETKLEHASLPQLAMPALSESGQIQEQNPADAEPFGLPTMTALPNNISANWAALQPRLLTEARTLAACRSGERVCPAAARRLLSFVDLGRQQQGRTLLGRINRAVNMAIRPMSDWTQYGVGSYWATPFETLSSGVGDCKDYAILKYVVLREAGISPEDLRLVIVHDIKGRTNHAVLSVRDDGKWVILDNRTLIVINADVAQYYYPLFVIDHRGVRTFITAAASH
jgi:predicted transglutaminase-like cysteine proteinase